MRIAIYGTGGLGGYYGARLARAGHEVAFVARGAHLEAIRERGLRVLSPVGDMAVEAALASDDPGAIGAVDLVVVAVKTWQVPEVARAMRPLVAEGTRVVPFLNGVEASDQLVAALGPGPVLGGLSRVFSLIEGPGVIRHLSPGDYLELGELDGRPSARAEGLVATLREAGIDAHLSADVRTELWKKLVMVSSWSGLGALSRSPMGVVRSRPGLRALVDRAIDEGIATATAAGFPPGKDFKAFLWSFYDGLPPDTTSSMYRDIVAGRPSELDAWNGAIVRFGARHGVDTPVQSFTWEALVPMECRARGEPDA